MFNVANGAIEHKDKSAQRELEFLESPIFGLDDEDNLREMMFPFHLQEYLNKLTEVLKPDSISQLIDAIAERHPKSLNRDVMLAKLLKDEYDGNDHAIIARKLFTDSGVFEMIYGNKTENSKLPDIGLFEGSICEFKHGTITDSGYTNLVELIRREFEGKMVYLDFWATWCGPCIEANKSLPEVAEFFKDKDVAFVSVALKSDFDKWGKLVRRHPETCKDYFIKKRCRCRIDNVCIWH